MIWFSCTKCGKAISRAEASAGAFVFCDCGQGNVVPWESTREASAVPSPIPVEPPALPPLELVPVSEEKIPVVRRATLPQVDDGLDTRRWEQTQRKADACFNHQDRLGTQKCADCSENFCSDCLVVLKGAALCGPCKNYRLRQVNKPSAVCGKAVVGVLLALCCAPVVMCLLPLGTNSFSTLVGFLALLGQIAATVLGGAALRETEKNPRLGGRSLAITTIVTGGLAFLMTSCFLVAGMR